MVIDEANPPVFMRVLDALPDALTSMVFYSAWIFPQIFSVDFLGNLASLASLEVAFCIVLAVIHMKLDLNDIVGFLMAVVIFSVCAVWAITSITPTASGLFILIPYGLIIFSKLNYAVFRESSSVTTRKRIFFAGFSCVICVAVLALVFLLPVPQLGMDDSLARSLPHLPGIMNWGYDNIHIAYAFGSLHFLIIAIMRYRWNLQLQRNIWN